MSQIAPNRDNDIVKQQKAVPVPMDRIKSCQHTGTLGVDTSFFCKLTPGCRQKILSGFDTAARESPQPRIGRIGASDQKKASVDGITADGNNCASRFRLSA